MTDSMICRDCEALAHYWSQPREEGIELAGELFSILRFGCICQCGCPAVLTTTLPGQVAPSVP